MNFKVTLTKRANEDIRGILAYYSEHSTEASQSFAKELITSLDIIAALPKGFPVSFANVRKMVMQGFPFNIFYAVKPKKKEVVIARVWHQKRNPKTLNK